MSIRYFELRQVLDTVTGAVCGRVTGLTVGRNDVIVLEPDGYDGYRVEVSKSSGPMNDFEREAALGYVHAALAERGLGVFGRKTSWSDIVAASSA